MPPEQTPPAAPQPEQQPQPPVAPVAPPQPQPVEPTPPAPVPPAHPGKTNTMAILGLVFAFLIPLLGLIFSLVGLSQIKKRQEGGHGLAVAGTIISSIFIIFNGLLILVLVMGTFSGVQTKARDTERETDIKALHGQLEAYYAENAKYPTLAELNDAQFRSKNLRGLDEAALRDPQNVSGEAVLVENPKTGFYAYRVTSKTGQPCNNKTVICEKYKLGATLEDNTLYTKDALN